MKQKIITTDTEASSSKVLTHSSVCCTPTEESFFFCNEPAGSPGLHDLSTYQLDQNVRECALHLEDTELLAKLAPAGMIALDAKFHLKSLDMLYNRARQATSIKEENEDEVRMHGIAFAELVTFTEEMHEEGCTAVFKLADLGIMYKD